jgi:hypothetical protein
MIRGRTWAFQSSGPAKSEHPVTLVTAKRSDTAISHSIRLLHHQKSRRHCL